VGGRMKEFHYCMQTKYWEGYSPLEVEANLIFRPYLYNKIRILGKVDIKKLLELRYKTNAWIRSLI